MDTRRRTRSSRSIQENGSSPIDIEREKERIRLKRQREKIVLWRHPIQTVYYCLCEAFYLLIEYCQRLRNHKLGAFISILFIGLIYIAVQIPGPHQPIFDLIGKKFLWSSWWVWLGFLSSVGLGTGLHTFLLYLGPFIAQVTMSAYMCNSVDFREPPYPNDFQCPLEESQKEVSIWQIMAKVRLEAFMWGLGTAIGELPPYFIARASKLSGRDDDDEPDEFEELEQLRRQNPQNMSNMDKAKLMVENLVEKVGFFGILLCASIPNPLFDLAGITCGHFLVPFWTFFGATIIGKAVIKMHIQKLFVIFLFNEPMLEAVVDWLGTVPLLGMYIQPLLLDMINSQKQKLKLKGVGVEDSGSIIGWIFDKVIFLVVVVFIISIVNSLAQSYHKRLHKHSTHSNTTRR